MYSRLESEEPHLFSDIFYEKIEKACNDLKTAIQNNCIEKPDEFVTLYWNSEYFTGHNRKETEYIMAKLLSILNSYQIYGIVCTYYNVFNCKYIFYVQFAQCKKIIYAREFPILKNRPSKWRLSCDKNRKLYQKIMNLLY